MTFISNATEEANSVMLQIDPVLADTYTNIIRFLVKFPSAASAMKGKNAPEIGSLDYIRSQAHAFADSRNPRAPLPPATVPDEMVSLILHEYFNVPLEDLDRAKREHSLSMGAENLVGELLERYLASVLEPKGWVWCSGSMIRAVDFIKPPLSESGEYRLLQVKNRDNSENSSSSAIRTGTSIEKWFRTFSKKTGSNWTAFPDASIQPLMSEDAFRLFVTKYLHELRS